MFSVSMASHEYTLPVGLQSVEWSHQHESDNRNVAFAYLTATIRELFVKILRVTGQAY